MNEEGRNMTITTRKMKTPRAQRRVIITNKLTWKEVQNFYSESKPSTWKME